MVVLGMVFPAPKPIALIWALLMMGFGAVKIVGAYPIHWRASTHPTGCVTAIKLGAYRVFFAALAEVRDSSPFHTLCDGAKNTSKHMKETVYIETSIFSFYYDERSSHSIIAMRNWTRKWWNNHRENYLLTTSTAVFGELKKGNKSHKQKSLELALTLPAMSPTDEIEEIIQVYFKHRLMPKDPLGDALHLALASYQKSDYLLTWNCKNLANANKFTHIKRINTLLGLHVPILTTPLELMGETS